MIGFMLPRSTGPLLAAFLPAALLLGACAGGGSGSAAGTAAGTQVRTLPRGTGEAEIRRFCTNEAQRQAESIPAVQSGQTTYIGGKIHDFEGCLKRHGL